jgi:predicted permease
LNLETAYSLFTGRFMDWLWQDVRYAARSLRRAPTVTVAAVITLALGIGAVTTIFSLFQAVLLRQLPVRSPEQLYFIAHGVGADLSTSSHYPWFERVSLHRDVFDGIAAYNLRDFKVSSEQGVERVAGQYVSGNYHAIIGAPIQIGRGFSDENDRVVSAVAVISDGYWTRQFQRRADVLGQTLEVGNHPVTIVGVTAPGFDGLQPGRQTDITLPLSLRIQDDPEFVTRIDTWTSMPLVVRLKAGVDARLATDVIGATYRAYMTQPGNQEFSRTSRGELTSATLRPASRGTDRLRQQYETPLQVLMGMVGVVLLIACVNVANLLLTQVPVRAREVAVRMSVGASRRRIAAQLLTEHVLLAIAAGGLGVLIAVWGTDFVSMLFQTGMNPIVLDVQPDRTVLIFALAVSVVTAMGFGLAPAWKTTHIDLPLTLKVGATLRGTGGRRLGPHGLVVLQVALSLVLVFGATLLARTVQNLRTLDTGFQKESIVLFELDSRDTRVAPERLADLCADVIARLRARPGAQSGSCSTMSPVATNSEGRPVMVPGFTGDTREAPIAWANSIDDQYFDTLGIGLLRGRAITAADTATTPRVAVLSEAMARYYFADQDPIGRTFSFGRSEVGPPITIVGVVRNARQRLRETPPHMAYTPLTQRNEPSRGLLAAVRTAGETAAIAAGVREEVRALSRDVGIPYVRTMDEQIGASLVAERLLAALSSAFAVLALVLACVGLYGVMSYDVARRSRDIGIRLALGAPRAQVLGQVLRQSSAVTMLGIVIGTGAAMAAARTLSTFLFGLDSNDRATLVFTIAVLGLTSLVAGYLPARRASRVDPAVTLRTE